MTRRSMLLALLVAPFSWLAAKLGRKPEPAFFKSGCVSMRFSFEPEPPNEAPFSRTLAEMSDVEWTFPDGTVYWKVQSEPPRYLFKVDAREVDVPLRGVHSIVTLYDSVDQS